MNYLSLLRHLDAFHVASAGEARIYTSAKVTDHHRYLYKAHFFGLDVYDDDHRRFRVFNPGFDLLHMPGANLKVVGVLKRRASLEAIEDTIKNPGVVATRFYRQVLIPAIRGLDIFSRTRRHNLAISNAHHLPSVFRIYPEDLPTLSGLIRGNLRGLPEDAEFTFYFLYLKLGQQRTIPLPSPLTLESLGLDVVIADSSKIEFPNFHLALSFHHSTHSLLWDGQRTACLLIGTNTNRYPLMGLWEASSVTMTFPRSITLQDAWPSSAQDVVHCTYAQAYTPFTKPLENSRPCHDHPFLFTYLLGRNLVQRDPAFKHIAECTVELKEIRALQEAIVLNLTKCTARYVTVLMG